MATPQANAGLKKAATVQVQICIQQLQHALPAFPFDSDENKAVMKALSALTNGFGKSEAQTRELIPAETLSMLQAAGAGGQSPGQAAMAGKPPIPGPGAPPGTM